DISEHSKGLRFPIGKFAGGSLLPLILRGNGRIARRCGVALISRAGPAQCTASPIHPVAGSKRQDVYQAAVSAAWLTEPSASSVRALSVASSSERVFCRIFAIS